MALNLDKSAIEKQYFYEDLGNTFGPFTLSILLTKITADTLVYREGIKWTKAKEIPEIKNYFESKKLVEKKIRSNQVNFIKPIIETKKSTNRGLWIFIILLSLVGISCFFYNQNKIILNENSMPIESRIYDSLPPSETLLVEPESYSSSSILPTSSGFSYNSELVGDDDYKTWWSPSEKNKCWLQINFVNNVSINYIDILAGSHFPSYKNLGNLYLKNLRVKEIKLEFSDGTSEKLSLRDVDEVQKVEFRKRECKFVRISPLNYFPSEKWNDVCISYLKFGRGN